MAYVQVPKDLTKVKNKVAFNLTKRQIICILLGAALGIPFYFLTRNTLGTSNAATGMVILMLPAFLFAMYEKDGMHLEQILSNIIRVKILRPSVRRYETVNLFEGGMPDHMEENRKTKGGTKHDKTGEASPKKEKKDLKKKRNSVEKRI